MARSGQTEQFESVLPIYDVSQWSCSSWKCMTKPELARLHEASNCHASWCGRVGDWLQIDLGRDLNVGSVLSQGARDEYGFVKEYTLSYRTASGSWVNYEENGDIKPDVLRIGNISKAPVTGYQTTKGPGSDGMRICREKGADLVKVSSAEENNFLRRSGKKWWLALRRDAIHKNMFKWNDGSMPNFTDWSIGEPNNANGNEECANCRYNGKWNDMGCSATVEVACEKENIDVIFATRGVGEHNPGILFGYHAFTRTYRLSVSTTNQNWELRLPENPLGWVHVGITWSKQWGLRFYPNGVLAAKATNPASIPYTFYDKYTKFLDRAGIIFSAFTTW
ncbi:hypothetical protein OS493_033019 [Desmophyllum pertusum]|uniref:Uncharacterized protein n=1 Tax=Desmophyllum pertusum TaxID=174260 RepID=A0A9W9ZMF3_9CNID|nr:hypothetical protein OS493_033019 [Desmophyllum pertusum]